MIENWNNQVEVVLINDINDPPNWVEHAKKFHGNGILVTLTNKLQNYIENQTGMLLKWI